MFELTDQAFTGVRPLLAADRRRGRPCRDHRQVLGGIIWKLHTDRPWRDVPERFGPWQTCYGRLRRWQRDGPGRGSGRCWPQASTTQATIAATRRRRQWQWRARA
jgi:transposase